MNNRICIDIIDLSTIVDICQKIDVSYDDDTFGYAGTIEGCPISLARVRIIQIEAVDDTLKITLFKE